MESTLLDKKAMYFKSTFAENSKEMIPGCPPAPKIGYSQHWDYDLKKWVFTKLETIACKGCGCKLFGAGDDVCWGCRTQ